ncbi:MAG: TlpA family protein disulfide reductase [bacterium]|nr:TlpA family protein disulfide reductase [bacterium]
MHRRRFFMGLTASLALPLPLALRAPAVATALPGDRAHASFARGIIAPGHPMPAMTAPTVEGREISLATLRGEALWINCFATWCEPCNQEMPTIVSAAKRYAARGLRVLGISMSESASAIPPFAKRFGIAFPIVLDHEQATNVWGITDIPTSIFVDAGGIVRSIHLGELERREALAAIESVLSRA